MLNRLSRNLRLLMVCFVYLATKTQAFSVNIEEMTSQASQIHSAIINENISLDIYLPKEVSEPDKTFATMYVMDSQHYFFNAIGYQNSLRNGVNASPAFIVVGINTSNIEHQPGERYQMLGPQADIMIALIEQNIIPYIDSHYQTNGTRMYFGWQFAAGFGLELFNKRPELFEGYFLASSPTFTEQRLAATKSVLEAAKKINNYFYLSLGESELHATTEYQRLAEMFHEQTGKGIKWRYHLSPEHNHQSTPLDSFTTGLNWYFNDFPDLTFYSVADVKAFGGVSAVKAYYRHRGERYHMSSEIGEQAKFSIFRHAAEENNWQFFQKFEQASGQYQPSDNASEGWYRFFGKFFIENQAFNKAEQLFQRGLAVYPDSASLTAKLAESQEKQGKLAQALANYHLALTKTAPDDEQYSHYQQQVQRLKQALVVK